MQRCGVETLVLEARDRVGGRVHSFSGAGFSAPIDLGASIITGTATDTAKGLRADPSAVVARSVTCREGVWIPAEYMKWGMFGCRMGRTCGDLLWDIAVTDGPRAACLDAQAA